MLRSLQASAEGAREVDQALKWSEKESREQHRTVCMRDSALPYSHNHESTPPFVLSCVSRHSRRLSARRARKRRSRRRRTLTRRRQQRCG